MLGSLENALKITSRVYVNPPKSLLKIAAFSTCFLPFRFRQHIGMHGWRFNRRRLFARLISGLKLGFLKFLFNGSFFDRHLLRSADRTGNNGFLRTRKSRNRRFLLPVDMDGPSGTHADENSLRPTLSCLYDVTRLQLGLDVEV